MTITTAKGLFRYTRLPFGVSSAPAKLQKTMDILMTSMEGVVVPIDDVLIGAKDLEQLKERLILVFQHL